MLRDEPEFTKEEQIVIDQLKEDGWQFRFEEDWNHHHGRSDGYGLLFKSPRMVGWAEYHGDEVNLEPLLKRETHVVAFEEAESRMLQARCYMQGRIAEIMLAQPGITRQQLTEIPINELLH